MFHGILIQSRDGPMAEAEGLGRLVVHWGQASSPRLFWSSHSSSSSSSSCSAAAAAASVARRRRRVSRVCDVVKDGRLLIEEPKGRY